MITLFQAFFSQVLKLLFGTSLLWLRCIIQGDKIEEIFPDYFKNKYMILFLCFIWFGVCTWIVYYYQIPHWGIWQYLFESKVGCLVAIVIIALHIMIIKK